MKTKIITFMFAILLISFVGAEVFQTPGAQQVVQTPAEVNPADVFTTTPQETDNSPSFIDKINWIRFFSLLIGAAVVIFTLFKSFKILKKKLKRKPKYKVIKKQNELYDLLEDVEIKNGKEFKDANDLLKSIDGEEEDVREIQKKKILNFRRKVIKIEQPEEMKKLVEKIERKDDGKIREEKEFKEVLKDLGIDNFEERMRGLE